MYENASIIGTIECDRELGLNYLLSDMSIFFCLTTYTVGTYVSSITEQVVRTDYTLR